MGEPDFGGNWILFDAWTMISKYLIQSYVDGWGCVSSLLFGLRPNYGRDRDHGGLLQKNLCTYSCIQCLWPCSRPLLTLVSARDSWSLTEKSGSVSCGDTLPFSWLVVSTRFCLHPPWVYLPSPVEVLKSNSTGLQSQIPWGFSVPFPDPQVGKSVLRE